MLYRCLLTILRRILASFRDFFTSNEYKQLQHRHSRFQQQGYALLALHRRHRSVRSSYRDPGRLLAT